MLGREFFRLFPLSDKKMPRVPKGCRAGISRYIPLPISPRRNPANT